MKRIAIGIALLGCACDDAGTTTSSSSSGTGGSGGKPDALVCTAPSITKGPWSLRVNDTSAVVRWEACATGTPGAIDVTPEAGGATTTVDSTETPITLAETYAAPLFPDAPKDYAGTYYSHEAAIQGLAPGTCYRYALAADPERKGRFCTAHAPGEPFKFMAIGDTNPALGSTAGVIAHAIPENPEFVIHGGDIQYYDSRIETWASWFPTMQPMLAQGAFFAAIGNHESEQSTELSEYSLRFFGGAGFDGGDTYYRFENGGVWFFSMNTEESISQGSEQGVWLETGLAEVSKKPGYRFSVVYFHKPIVTCGDTGDDPMARAYLEPLFQQYKVMFVLQAHMHGYERFEFPNGVTYITAAGGGGLIENPSLNVQRDYCGQRLAVGDYYHSVIFSVGATEVTGKVIDRDGAVRDTFTKPTPTP